MFESLRTIDPEDQRQTPLAKCLLPAIQCNKIVDEINQLSKTEVVLQKKLLSKAGHAKSEPIHVFEVEVSCTQGTLKVNEKDAANKDAFFHSTSGHLVRNIWIYSISVNAVDAKLTVFMNYESYLKEQTIYIHHVLENAEHVINKSLGTDTDSFSESVLAISINTIIQEATDKILSTESIKRFCCDIFLWDKNVAVGTTEDASYSCRSIFTVRRLKEQLVERTLHKTAEALGSEICSGILKHVESDFQTNLEQSFSDLKFKISDELFEKITSVVVFIILVAFNNPLLGIIVALSALVATFIWSVNVNSTDWRTEIADEIYGTVVKNNADILSNIEGQVKNMCWLALYELNEVSDKLMIP